MSDPDRLEAGIRAWIAREAEISAELPEAADLASRRARARELSDRLAEEFAGPIHPDAVIREREAPVSGGLFVRRFLPSGATGPLPTQVYLHGGGFVSGTARERINAVILSDRAVRAGIQICALDYRLAPEHPYPAAVEDTLAFLRLLAADPSWQADPARLAVGGNSAGGHVAAVAALRSREGGEVVLRHQLLEVPALSFRLDWPSIVALADETARRAAEAAALAYRGGAEADDLFEVASADPSGAPPATILTAEFDPLRDGAEAYARRLEAAGVPTRLRRGAGQLHGTTGLLAAVASARDWQDAAVDALRAHCGTD